MKTKSGFEYDFSGWATKNDIRCSDGRTIRKNAFANDDGKIVPLVYMHNHDDIENVLGHALLENLPDGVYAYCSLNNTAPGQHAKEVVRHTDLVSLSIWANNLDQKNGNVLHGSIKEVSICLAGANKGAVIDFPYFAHSDELDTSEAWIWMSEPVDKGEDIEHSEGESKDTSGESEEEFQEEEKAEDVQHEDKPAEEEKKETSGKSVGDVLDTMDKDQRAVTDYLVAKAIADTLNEGGSDEAAHSDEGEDENMKTNTFDAFGESNTLDPKTYLTHSEGKEIIEMAKDQGISLKTAMNNYAKAHDKELMHGEDDLGFKNIDRLFPDYKLVNGPAPEKILPDQGWVGRILKGISKSPLPRLRTRYTDLRDVEQMRPKGYKKGTLKDFRGNLDLFGRTTDAITVYVKGKLDRDDIIDITDFNIVDYLYQIDRMHMDMEIARAILIGDGRSGDKAIDQTKIRPIWTDDELYTIHELVDVQGMRTTMNGSDSSKHFGDNYVYAEAVLQSLLYAREKYKGSGNPVFFCHPHLVNVMLLARDLNGRRIYDNVGELTSALNVKEIITVEQFEGKTRQVTVEENGSSTVQTRKILGIMVNLSDYTVGCAKGGEITHFTDFDLNFNQEISLLETRISGSLLKPWSAIALEELDENP